MLNVYITQALYAGKLGFCQAVAARVFASFLLSIIYILNGRKVIAWILWIMKMTKI